MSFRRLRTLVVCSPVSVQSSLCSIKRGWRQAVFSLTNRLAEPKVPTLVMVLSSCFFKPWSHMNPILPDLSHICLSPPTYPPPAPGICRLSKDHILCLGPRKRPSGHTTLVWITALSLRSCVTLDKVFDPSEPQFLHLYNADTIPLMWIK